VREHGGDNALANITSGGLRARVELHVKRAVDEAWRRNSAAGR
jgi:hypothetical protein